MKNDGLEGIMNNNGSKLNDSSGSNPSHSPENEEKYGLIIQNMPQGFVYGKIVYNKNHRFSGIVIEDANSSFESMSGLNKEKIIGKRISESIEGIIDSEMMEKIRETALMGKAINFDEYIAKLNRWYSFSAYKPDSDSIAILFSDITEKKKDEKELIYSSSHDFLTGLYNRSFFNAEMERMGRGRFYPISVMAADLDGLKIVNDNLGHSEGDNIIIKAAGILKDCFRSSDIVARTGGDEFSILLPETTISTAEEKAEHIRKSFENYNLENNAIPLHISLGIATAESGNKQIEQLLCDADSRMYEDKSKNGIPFHYKILEYIKNR
ncbi:MAG: sensor domain-containing diguanylate cyclase [Candidatus Woesearchaeota archaeon]|nr:sensor domain-containing diguanylate cyclase [Candidatus Woesearchaeota archaeon]